METQIKKSIGAQVAFPFLRVPHRLLVLAAFVLYLFPALAQSPEKMSYQAVIRNSINQLVTNTQIGMEINIRQGSPAGTIVYTETQTPSTNANGLVSIEIGGGAGFNTINWGTNTYFIETKTAVAPPLTTYTITGVSQLLSVPYALNAKTADNGITTAQADAIVANTAKVGYTDALVSANPDVVANTAKVGITAQQASDITANNAKVGITTAQADAIVANTAKVGYTDALVSANPDVAANTAKVGYTDALVSANPDVVANTAKVGITTAQANAIAANTAKVGYTDALVSANPDVVANTAKVGITAQQASDITTNNAKVGITTAQADAIAANTAKVGYTDALVSANPDVVANTVKVGITAQQASDITANNAKVGITTAQADAIVANTAKVGYTDALVSANPDVVANTAKVGITTAQANAIAANTAKISAAIGTQTGQMQYWNGTAWVTVASGLNGQVLRYKNGVPTWTDGNINDLTLGDSYQGGFIAYILQSGDPEYIMGEKQGIIAARSNQSTGMPWNTGSLSPLGTATAIGSGNANTNAIIANQGVGSYAAQLCADLVLEGHSDWYLPSKDELNKLYLNREAIGGFTNNNYWSSSENGNNAWGQNFNGGGQGSFGRGYWGYVRCVRAF